MPDGANASTNSVPAEDQAPPPRRGWLARLRPRSSGSRAFTAIRNRFVAVNLPLILIATLGLYGVSEWMVSSFSHLALKEELHKVSTQVARVVTPQVAQNNRDQVRNVLTGAAANSDLRGIEVRDRTGKLVAQVGKTNVAGALNLRHRMPLIDRTGAKPVQVGSLVVTLSDSQIVAATDARRQIVAIIALCLAMVAVVIGMVVQESTIRAPLKRLIEAIRRREQTGDKVLVDWKSSDEPGQVIDAFNELQEREEMFIAALRQAQNTLEKKVEERTAELAAARDEARAAVEARDAFMAKLSHELRTPLNAIVGFSEMLEHGVGDVANPATVRDYGRDINRSGRHLLGLIEDLLDLSRIEMGKHDLEEREVSLPQLIGKCAQMIRNDVTARNHKLVVGSVPGKTIVCDELKLSQVLINLLTNAVKYTGDGGRIELLCKVSREGLAIHVTDNGPGIAPEDQATIFEPFYQGASARREGVSGAGLGLSLARSFIELHGGQLKVHSKVGHGTCMSIWLPRDRVVGARAPASGNEEALANGPMVIKRDAAPKAKSAGGALV